jgi:vancomycin permeability regulator SanA
MKTIPITNKRTAVKKILIWLIVLAALFAASVNGVSAYVVSQVKDRIISPEEAAALEDVDCILVLGAGIRKDNTPSRILKDRLTQGIALYENGASEKLLMSGDNSREHYNEGQVMKDYAVGQGVPAEDIFQDHAGFSTYESVYRAKDIFQADKIIIVTQDYHMYRALYIAEQLGIEAYGVSAEENTYGGQTYRDAREMLARAKDAMFCLVKPKPTFLGEAIPLIGNGNVTD